MEINSIHSNHYNHQWFPRLLCTDHGKIGFLNRNQNITGSNSCGQLLERKATCYVWSGKVLKSQGSWTDVYVSGELSQGVWVGILEVCFSTNAQPITGNCQLAWCNLTVISVIPKKPLRGLRNPLCQYDFCNRSVPPDVLMPQSFLFPTYVFVLVKTKICAANKVFPPIKMKTKIMLWKQKEK